MKVTVATIGKMSSRCPENEIIQDYLKRLPWQVAIKEGEAKKGLKGQSLQAAEGKILREFIPPRAKKIVLDERGKIITSRDFATFFTRMQDEGCQEVALLIGGADGHEAEMRKEADLILSLGKMVWPHMLVRAMLMEQLYRAHTIMTGHPYHRD